MRLLGPFSQVLPFTHLPEKGPISDDRLEVIRDGGVVLAGERIIEVGAFSKLRQKKNLDLTEISQACVLLPGFVDSHTHMCYAGSRARDYALRVAGVSYLEIAGQGGGILDTVARTRAATAYELAESLMRRCDRRLQDGVTTCEVKSGYGLTLDDEIKMLTVIQEVNNRHALDIVSTCLAAHIKPKEFDTHAAYLKFVVEEILPAVLKKKLARRVDIFVEEGAFPYEVARDYLKKARDMGFSLVVHADQFLVAGSRLACELGVLSADHLEMTGDAQMKNLARAGVIATVLPGASLGLGMPYAPARKLLDHGCAVVIASDWNPGSAPMGDLLLQAAVLGAAERLTMAETLAALTVRAVRALGLSDRGELAAGKLADMIAFPCDDYREILYHQGQMKPAFVWKRGRLLKDSRVPTPNDVQTPVTK